MKSDSQIQKDVMAELAWEPFLNSSEIGVAVKNGVVTLSGRVDSYAKKLTAEKAAKSVAGVRIVAEDIQVGVSPKDQKSDTEIAEAVLNALKWSSAAQEEKIKIKVENGVVRLDGEVEWDFQRQGAAAAIEYLNGVLSVINLITVKPRVSPTDIKSKIAKAFQRHATLDSQQINVEASGSNIILKGKVRSFAEKDDAEREAWFAPGVTSVENKLEIMSPVYEYEE